MTWNEALHYECPSCGKQAQFHRMAPKRMYCPELNASGRARYYPGRKPMKVIADVVLRCRVSNLKTAPIPNEVREAIKSGLTTFA